MKTQTSIKPFDNFRVLDGYHCQTNSFAKIFSFYNSPLSEEMLLGIGAGMGFLYWHQRGITPFLGGRDNNNNFHMDIGRRTGVLIDKKTTSSEARAEKLLIEMLNNRQPVMMFVDMVFFPALILALTIILEVIHMLYADMTAKEPYSFPIWNLKVRG